MNLEEALENLEALSERLPTDVYLESMPIVATPAAELDVYLSATEQDLHKAFKHASRRDAFFCGRKLLKSLLAKTLGKSISNIQVDILESGALSVANEPVFVSITHSKTDVAAVVAPYRIGIDLEWIRVVHPNLHLRLLHREEHEGFEAIPLPLHEKQLQFWSMKEAYLKAIQTGFRTPANSFQIVQGKIVTEKGTWQVEVEKCAGHWLSVCYEIL